MMWTNRKQRISLKLNKKALASQNLRSDSTLLYSFTEGPSMISRVNWPAARTASFTGIYEGKWKVDMSGRCDVWWCTRDL